MNVVVVESPAKAKTINKYLGAGYQVLSSYGHVRDLPEKDGSVLPDDDFAMIYEPLEDKKKRLDDIATALRDAETLFLATDPDREGEAISWHLSEALAKMGALKGVDVKRVVFHEVTKRAVTEAIGAPRALDDHLIDAYQARRALDYLVGFNLSPVLWRKMPGSRSAGRVQSVALKLICGREDEIEAFVAREYWTIEALLKTPAGAPFTARLSKLDGAKLGRFDLADETAAQRAKSAVEQASLRVAAIERKKATRNPPPPFSTSTLQQEAARKLGFSADRTMKTAQRLFEGVAVAGETVGLITYMRTDSVQLSQDALKEARMLIGSRFGDPYLPSAPRQFKTKTKNAQEAHEAIRPTEMSRSPDRLKGALDGDQAKLYELIWKRTIASQMAAAILDRVAIDVEDANDPGLALRATGQTVAFDGFLKLYQEGRDEPSQDDEGEDGRLLPPMKERDPIDRDKVEAKQHFTEPPPRFTEASLVKKMEELGIGRPSTYASIISVLQNRQYVRLEQRRFHPEDRGRLVSAFLDRFFDRWVEFDFTAKLEDQLDDVARGERSWKDVLRAFWTPFRARVDDVQERRVAEVIDALNEGLDRLLFPPREDGAPARLCPLCNAGQLSLKLGRYGAFVGCSNYPECRYTRKLGEKPSDKNPAEEDKLLGVDPANGEEVWLKFGRFGPYVQSADKRGSIPPPHQAAALELATALLILALPREIGADPESGEKILAGMNRYGPFVQRARQYVRLGADEDVLTIGMNRALTLLAEAPKGRGRAAASAKALKELGDHPETGEKIAVLEGRFGPYVKLGKTNASLPKDADIEAFTLDQALALIEKKRERDAAKKGGAKKAAPKKPAAAKKPAAKKAAADSADDKPPAAKKPAAKKAGGQKTAAKKPAAKKTPAKTSRATKAASDDGAGAPATKKSPAKRAGAKKAKADASADP